MLCVNILDSLQPPRNGRGAGVEVLVAEHVRQALVRPAVAQDPVDEVCPPLVDPVLLQAAYHGPNLPHALLLVLEGKEDHQPEAVVVREVWVVEQLNDLVGDSGTAAAAAGELLLQLRRHHEGPPLDDGTHLTQKGDMLGDGALLRLELGEGLDKPHHFLDRLDVPGGLRLLLEVVDEGLDREPEVAVVAVHVVPEERVLRRGEDDLRVVLVDFAPRGCEVHSVVADPDEVVDHRLVGPLEQQGGHRVVAAVDEKEHDIAAALPKVVEGPLLVVHEMVQAIRDPVAELAVPLVADRGPLAHRHREAREALDQPVLHRRAFGVVPAEGLVHDVVVGSEGDGEVVALERLKVPVKLLNLVYKLTRVALSKFLQGEVAHCSGEIYVVLPITWIPQFFPQVRNVFPRGSKKAHSLQMKKLVTRVLQQRVY
mmetsp:Transcript_14431/g.34202  ORF Transcript_14431/g.34202 Transcript_14431/m.34202 type:complete len:426 (+) Transcript_14431:507-1784(+)